VQPSRTSVVKKQSLLNNNVVIGEHDIMSPAGVNQNGHDESDKESRHLVSGMETQTNEKTLAGQEAWNVTAS